MSIEVPIFQHILQNLPNLLNRDFVLDIFTITEKTKARLTGDGTAIVEGKGPIYQGKFLDVGGELYVITTETEYQITTNQGESLPVKSLGVKVPRQISERNTPIILQPGDIVNLKSEVDVETTMGRLILNYVILVDPFGDLIPYINDQWNIGKIEDTYLFESLRTEKITVADIKKYSRNVHWLGHFTELSVPNFTQKALVILPEIIKRRDELLAENKDAIAAGDTIVMSKIEQELIAMDRANMIGDPSTLFYDTSVSKSYGVHRKNMFLLGGMVQEFGDKGFKFVDTSLEDGWDPKNFATLCNEIRRGSYNRAKETAKGGEETKFLIRVFQNTQIVEDDCNSTNYLEVYLSKAMASKYLYRNILKDDKIITLTAENIGQFINTRVLMRSPMTCHTKAGYCFKCLGDVFKTTDQDVLTMSAVNISSTFTTAALKSMHGVAAKQISISSLNQYVY